MMFDRLYDLAFQYKKTRLWEKIGGAHIFAVKLSDDRIGYISVMMAHEGVHGLCLYIGDEGFWTFWNLWKAGGARFYDQFYLEELMELKCLQCTFESKEGLSAEEHERAKAFVRSHGIKLGGKYAYPRFGKKEPYCVPWDLQTEDEADCLCLCLSATAWIADSLEGSGGAKLNLDEINGETKTIPMVEVKDGVHVLSQTELPQNEPPRWPEPKRYNEITAANLKKAKRQGIWQCEIVRFGEPVQGGPEDIPAFPVIVLSVEAESGWVLPTEPMMYYEKNPEELLNRMLEAFVRQGLCPEKLEVRDERTFALVNVCAEKLGILVTMKNTLPELEDARMDLLTKMDKGPEGKLAQFIRMVNMLADMNGGRLPEEIMRQMEALEAFGLLPVELVEMLDETRALTSEYNARKAGMKAIVNKSYVISVSLARGCYRHIRISGTRMLWDLHRAIIEAFGFDDDHAHAFFLDNVKWSDRESYYTERVGDGGWTTENTRLGSVGLHKGKAFKYVFDFGDEWVFQCKVLREEPGDSGEPQVIRSKGEAPSQYGEWDDEEDW